jgi:hypothetical protein
MARERRANGEIEAESINPTRHQCAMASGWRKYRHGDLIPREASNGGQNFSELTWQNPLVKKHYLAMANTQLAMASVAEQNIINTHFSHFFEVSCNIFKREIGLSSEKNIE